MEKLTIITQTKDYLVVNKPAGLLTHPDSKEDQSVVTELLQDYPEIKQVGEDSTRPGIIHRLDKNASGLLVIARTQEFFQHIKQQFKNRQVKKVYQILIHGQIDQDEGEINFPIKRSSQGFKMAAVPEKHNEKSVKGKNLKQAKTYFWLEKSYINYSLVKAKIETGRTHQLRVHFLALAHPIVGDELYQTKKTKQKNQKLNLNRLFLVAKYLEFKDLEGNTQPFSIDLPPDLDNFLQSLK